MPKRSRSRTPSPRTPSPSIQRTPSTASTVLGTPADDFYESSPVQLKPRFDWRRHIRGINGTPLTILDPEIVEENKNRMRHQGTRRSTGTPLKKALFIPRQSKITDHFIPRQPKRTGRITDFFKRQGRSARRTKGNRK